MHHNRRHIPGQDPSASGFAAPAVSEVTIHGVASKRKTKPKRGAGSSRALPTVTSPRMAHLGGSPRSLQPAMSPVRMPRLSPTALSPRRSPTAAVDSGEVGFSSKGGASGDDRGPLLSVRRICQPALVTQDNMVGSAGPVSSKPGSASSTATGDGSTRPVPAESPRFSEVPSPNAGGADLATPPHSPKVRASEADVSNEEGADGLRMEEVSHPAAMRKRLTRDYDAAKKAVDEASEQLALARLAADRLQSLLEEAKAEGDYRPTDADIVDFFAKSNGVQEALRAADRSQKTVAKLGRDAKEATDDMRDVPIDMGMPDSAAKPGSDVAKLIDSLRDSSERVSPFVGEADAFRNRVDTVLFQVAGLTKQLTAVNLLRSSCRQAAPLVKAATRSLEKISARHHFRDTAASSSKEGHPHQPQVPQVDDLAPLSIGVNTSSPALLRWQETSQAVELAAAKLRQGESMIRSCGSEDAADMASHASALLTAAEQAKEAVARLSREVRKGRHMPRAVSASPAGSAPKASTDVAALVPAEAR